MPEVFSFEKAIQQTEDEDRALLIGNGFSANTSPIRPYSRRPAGRRPTDS